MTQQIKDSCFACLLFGRFVGWALLIFGGVVGVSPHLGWPIPSPFWERAATYLMAFSLLMFAVSYILRRMITHSTAH
jgi:hypothetical protein